MKNNEIKIALDVQGGDHGIEPIMEGGLESYEILGKNIQIVFVGDEEKIKPFLQAHGYPAFASVVHAPKEITMKMKIPKKIGYSMWEALQLTTQEETDATITTGNSGIYGFLSKNASGMIRPLKGPAVVQEIPLPSGARNVLTDVGLDVSSTPQHYLELALIGSAYAKAQFHIKNPRIGLLNVGEEAHKGGEEMNKIFEYLQRTASNPKHPLNFIGNVEGGDILSTKKADVYICDARVGNILLKFAENFLENMRTEMRIAFQSNVASLVGGMLSKSSIKKRFQPYMKAEHGAAPLLGLNHLCLLCHGNSQKEEIIGAIRKAKVLHENQLISEVRGIFLPFLHVLERKAKEDEKMGKIIPLYQKEDKST